MCNSCYKELTHQEIMKVLDLSPYCRLCVAEQNQPYCVPMCFTFECRGSQLFIWMLSDDKGHKMHCIENNSKVCLEFDLAKCCSVCSVVAEGTASIIKDHGHRCKDSMIEVKVSKITGREYCLKDFHS